MILSLNKRLWTFCLVLTINCSNLENKRDSSKPILPLVINTWAFTQANEAARKYLHKNPRNGLDALVEGCSTCERLQCDGSVGFGGSPDENGETRLDAFIMDGKSMNIGAVASMREIKDAIQVAKHVLLNTKHSMLVGEAATKFAEQMGFKRESLSTEKSLDIWKKWKLNKCQPNYWENVTPNPLQQCGPYKPLNDAKYHINMKRYMYEVGATNHDTIGMIVISEDENIYAGTSTNGATHKIPGRVGDSAIPGAGAYADNEVGAAVATGDGDVMMRFLPSILAVEALRSGKSPQEAANMVMMRIFKYYTDFSGGLVVADRHGNYSAACVGMENFPFSVSNGNVLDTRVEYVKCINSGHYEV